MDVREAFPALRSLPMSTTEPAISELGLPPGAALVIVCIAACSWLD
jgi:hypothetical protein